MRLLRNTFLCAALTATAACGADSTLLRLLMPDAKVIAGAQVDQAKTSDFGKYVLRHLEPDDPGFAKFVAATGFDPRRDVTEVIVASNWSQDDPSHWLVVAKGAFDPARITAVALSNGAKVTHYAGIPVITDLTSVKDGSQDKPHAGPDLTAIAFLDSSTAAMGELSTVQAAIDRRKSGVAGSLRLASKVRQVSAKNDFWFTTLVPLSYFAGAVPDPNIAGAMKGNLLGAIEQTSGGVKFGPTVQVSAEAITRSPKDASALVDVVKFVAGLIQTNRQNDNTAAQVSTLLDSLQASAEGNVMTMNLAVPEATLEQMIHTMRRQQAAPKAPAAK